MVGTSIGQAPWLTQPVAHLAGLVLGARHQHGPAVQRAALPPVQLRAVGHGLADGHHQRARRVRPRRRPGWRAWRPAVRWVLMVPSRSPRPGSDRTMPCSTSADAASARCARRAPAARARPGAAASFAQSDLAGTSATSVCTPPSAMPAYAGVAVPAGTPGTTSNTAFVRETACTSAMTTVLRSTGHRRPAATRACPPWPPWPGPWRRRRARRRRDGPRPRARVGEYACRHVGIGDHEIGLCEQVPGTDRQQSGVSGARAHESNTPRGFACAGHYVVSPRRRPCDTAKRSRSRLPDISATGHRHRGRATRKPPCGRACSASCLSATPDALRICTESPSVAVAATPRSESRSSTAPRCPDLLDDLGERTTGALQPACSVASTARSAATATRVGSMIHNGPKQVFGVHVVDAASTASAPCAGAGRSASGRGPR